MSTFHLKISTPDGLQFEGEVVRLRVRMIDGDVSLLIDEDLMASEYFGCHPCINTSSLRFTTDDLMKKIIPALKHEPRFVKL